MLFELPKQAYVHKVIPKNKFFARALVNTKLKREFTDKVQKITWEYKLAPDIIGIPSTSAVEEVQIFQIELKEKVIPKNVLTVIDKSIPYPILYVFTYQNHTAYGIAVREQADRRLYISEWGAPIQFRFAGLTLEAMYQGLVKSFITKVDTQNQNFAEVIASDKKRNQLEKDIAALKNKIRNERQFNKKVELNAQLQIRKAELENL